MNALLARIKQDKRASFIAMIVVTIVLLIVPFVAGSVGNSWVRIIDFALLYVLLALGLNIVVGFAGLLDLGYIAFYAVGAYLYALLASPHLTENFESIAAAFPNGLHTWIWIVIPLAGAVAALFGALLGAPTLRLRGDYLAIVTLGFGEIIRIFMQNLNAPYNITNGPQGINMIDPVTFGTVSLGKTVQWFGFDVPSLYLYYYMFLALVVLSIFFCHRLEESRIGRAWMAIREDEIAAKAMGINTRNTKLLAFAMGASFGGVSGAMFAAFQGFISPESFNLTESIIILAMVVLGGMGHIPGVVLGAVLLAIFPEALRHTAGPLQVMLFGRTYIDAEVLRLLLYGLAMVLVMLYRPKGLWPAPAGRVPAVAQHSKATDPVLESA
ncbi:branched-chain amino acid ABC transporter permease [soil metagenome]